MHLPKNFLFVPVFSSNSLGKSLRTKQMQLQTFPLEIINYNYNWEIESSAIFLLSNGLFAIFFSYQTHPISLAQSHRNQYIFSRHQIKRIFVRTSFQIVQSRPVTIFLRKNLLKKISIVQLSLTFHRNRFTSFSSFFYFISRTASTTKFNCRTVF